MKNNLSSLFVFGLIIIVSIFVLKFLFKLLYFLAPAIVVYIAYKYYQTRKIKKDSDKANKIFDAEYRDL